MQDTVFDHQVRDHETFDHEAIDDETFDHELFDHDTFDHEAFVHEVPQPKTCRSRKLSPKPCTLALNFDDIFQETSARQCSDDIFQETSARYRAASSHGGLVLAYRGTSLMRNSPPLGPP